MDFVVLQGPAHDWESSAHRRVENFVDFAHFAWVHDGVLGSRDNPEVPDHPVLREGSELRFTRTVREPVAGVTEYKDHTEQAGFDRHSCPRRIATS